MKGSFKTALIAAVVSTLVSAAAAVATTSNFILGSTANAPDAPTAVVAQNVDDLGGLNAPMIKLTNSSSGGSATPLALIAGVGRPGLTVNTKAKVANLNADSFDGFDSGYFLPKTGKAADANKLDGYDSAYFLPTTGKASDSDKLDGLDSTTFARGAIYSGRVSVQPGNQVLLFDVKGLASVSGVCYPDGEPSLYVYNNTSAALDLYYPGHYSTIAPGFFAGLGGEGVNTIQFGRTVVTGLSVIPHVATLTFGVHAGTSCRFQAQAVQQP
jgi:hypothetical protein